MPTQAEIAAHLGITQKSVSVAMTKLSLDWRTATMDEIRLEYLKRLREAAAGHVSAGGLDLVAEKAQTECVVRELKLLELQEKQGELINVEELKEDMTLTVLNFKNLLMARDERLKMTLDSIYGIDVDIGLLNDETYTALGALADLLDGDAKAEVLARDGAAPGAEAEHDGVGGGEPVSERQVHGAAGEVESGGNAVDSGNS